MDIDQVLDTRGQCGTATLWWDIWGVRACVRVLLLALALVLGDSYLSRKTDIWPVTPERVSPMVRVRREARSVSRGACPISCQQTVRLYSTSAN